MTSQGLERRHRTAIVRGTLSRPVRLATDLGLISTETSVFDYGCGHGEDVKALVMAGIAAAGWDPHFRPQERVREADVVNLGYVINVIPDVAERHQVVRSAWQLARRALIVSARLDNELRNLSQGRRSGDGFVTGHGTFQRFYSQAELRSWLDTTLELQTIAIAPGIFVAFKAEEDANAFLLRTRRRSHATVRVSRSDHLYDSHRSAFDDLIGFFGERGRLPVPGETPFLEQNLIDAVGSIKRAWRVVVAVTPDTDWNSIAAERRQDLLVELALLRLNRRPSFMRLPATTRYDVRGLVGTYSEATDQADRLLFSAGDSGLISAIADRTSVGKRLPSSLYVHVSALVELPHLLRVYEGCARWLVGEVEGANIVKMATDKPMVSYLEYPNFDRDPHPALKRSTYVRIGALDVNHREYNTSDNPPILHRKETFVSARYPGREKFKRLTDQEERLGLYDEDPRLIGNRLGWEERLIALNLALAGHRVVRRRPGR